MDEETEHDGVFLIGQSDVDVYYQYFRPQVLRFDAKTIIEKYHAVNFGACKGETFDRVLIYSNGPLTDFVMKGTALNAPEKYYVGVTRPRYSIAIVLKTVPNALNGYEEAVITCGDKQVRCLRCIVEG